MGMITVWTAADIVYVCCVLTVCISHSTDFSFYLFLKYPYRFYPPSASDVELAEKVRE